MKEADGLCAAAMLRCDSFLVVSWLCLGTATQAYMALYGWFSLLWQLPGCLPTHVLSVVLHK